MHQDQEFLNQFYNDDEEIAIAMILNEADQDDDDEHGDRRGEVINVDQNGFRAMSNASFKEHFRMDRIVFQSLIVVVGNHMLRTGRLQGLRTELDKVLMMGLWPLFNPDTYRSSGLLFGKKKGSIHYHYRYIVEVLSELADKFIKWPNALERDRIRSRFEENYGYIGAVGCIDGVHINITAPLEHPQNYVNRHHTYSILVQAVCDDRLLYRDVYFGNPGAIGDARNFEHSDLSKNIMMNPDMFPEGELLLGDGIYTLSDKLMIPYADDGNLQDWMRTHNAILSACRVKIENSFALLRAKNRRLKHLPMRNPYLVRYHIVASFVLHNFMILEGNECEGLLPVPPPPIPQEEYVRLTNEAMELGALRREFIANVLHPHL